MWARRLALWGRSLLLVACASENEREYISYDATIPDLPGDGASSDGGSDADASSDGGPDSADNRDPDGQDTPPTDAVDDAVVAGGAALYASLCTSCHGATGRGGIGPDLTDWTRSEADLVQKIDETMPSTDPSLCDAECAEQIAAFILAELVVPADCTTAPEVFGPRRLRLLNRREYRRTVQDLFQSELICLDDADCVEGTCLSGMCDAACGETEFSFDPAGRNPRSVHVAGSFNGWPGSLAGGGWALTRDPSSGLWVGAFEVPTGRHEYKFVIDESEWIADPSSASSVADGFGGQNSVLDITCDGPAMSLPSDLAATFPAETRPEGFGFDSHALSAAVGSVHVTEYLDAATDIAESVDLEVVVPCWSPRDTCTARFVEDFGRRAFRRPLTAAETSRYTALVAGEADMVDGVTLALNAFLVSPNFLYRAELGAPSGAGWRLTSWEAASALSYGLWGTMPDDTLLAAAAAGELQTPESVERAARRLLADRRAREMVRNFALQWLGAESVRTATKKEDLYPGFDEAMRESLAEETSRFVEHVVFDSTGSFDELLTADYTRVNAHNAPLYGLSATGESFVATPYADDTRAGVLGHGSVLASYGHSDQSSPIRRGLFVRRNLLCQGFPPPPANAGGVPEVDPSATTRERFRQHTDDPFCASCHQYIDDLGFGFERFDTFGRYRTTENGEPIEPDGNMNDLEFLGAGTDAPFENLAQLADALVSSEAAGECFVRQYYRFERGFLESNDQWCAIQDLNERFEESGRDVRELMVSLYVSHDFLNRR